MHLDTLTLHTETVLMTHTPHRDARPTTHTSRAGSQQSGHAGLYIHTPSLTTHLTKTHDLCAL